MHIIRFLIRPAVVPAWSSALLVLLLALFPAAALESSLRGLSIWWEVLFPALFPFFVISEVLLGFGIVHFFGKLLDPLMQPLFRIPGIGGFVVTMGYASGYPVGARLTAQLWEQRLITRAEGERLVAFTTTSDPIFLIGAVAVGFFHNAPLALLLAVSHYGGGLIVGFLMRFHDRRAASTNAAGPGHPGKQAGAAHSGRRKSRLAEALAAMHEARLLDGRSLGKLLQDAVQAALRLMIVVGGLVVVFSVVMELLGQAGAIGVLTACFGGLLTLFGLPHELSSAFVNGLFEVTLGARASGNAAGSGLIHQTAAAAFILSWAGLSVHAQVASLLSHTGLRYRPFLIARFVHGCIAAALVYLLWNSLGPSV